MHHVPLPPGCSAHHGARPGQEVAGLREGPRAGRHGGTRIPTPNPPLLTCFTRALQKGYSHHKSLNTVLVSCAGSNSGVASLAACASDTQLLLDDWA